MRKSILPLAPHTERKINMDPISILYGVLGVSVVTWLIAMYKRYTDMQNELFKERLDKVALGAINDAKNKSDADLSNAIHDELSKIPDSGSDSK